jgi:predicted nucleic acid-binding protein
MASTPPNPTRIFVDTSVLFAATRSETGFARDLIMAGARGDPTLIFSRYVIEEAQHNLQTRLLVQCRISTSSLHFGTFNGSIRPQRW